MFAFALIDMSFLVISIGGISWGFWPKVSQEQPFSCHEKFHVHLTCRYFFCVNLDVCSMCMRCVFKSLDFRVEKTI